MHISCNAEPTVLARAIGNRLGLDRRLESHYMSLLLSYHWNMIQRETNGYLTWNEKPEILITWNSLLTRSKLQQYRITNGITYMYLRFSFI